MQSLAKFAMRSPLHAIGVSALAASLPLLIWLSASVVALVALSQGFRAGVNVFLWTLIPMGIGFHYTSDPTSVFLVISAFLLALALRNRFSWEQVLVFASCITLIGTFLFYNIASTVFDQLIDIYNQILRGTDGIPALEDKELVKIMIAGYSVMFYFFSIAVVSLARWWQSCLYNPSGFGSEFHSLRLPPLVSMAAVLAVIFCLVFLDRLGVWVPFVVSPLFIAGLGLVHWTFEAAKISSFWLVGFYMGLFLFFQLFFPVLTSIAIIDSFFDLRSRFKFSKKE